MTQTYSSFLESKRLIVPDCGVTVDDTDLHPDAFQFQRDLTRFSLRKGRSGLFAGTGMGKTLMQLMWGQKAGRRVLDIAPLGVTRQTVREGERWGIPVTYARSQSQAAREGITITNYEMVDHFDPDAFDAVILDESSILKGLTSSTRKKLGEMFEDTPMRLCCTATPAPNDIAEIANHAEFLGIMSRTEMLAAFFVHDDEGWRLKRHAIQPFYRWLASWAVCITMPSDLGYSDDGYRLPPLTVKHHLVHAEYVPEGQLFATGLGGLGGRSKVRKQTVSDRVVALVELIHGEDERYNLCHEQAATRATAGVEPGVLSATQGASEPGTEGSDCELDARAERGEGGVHAPVSSGAYGEVGAHSGTARQDQRAASGEIRAGCGVSRAAKSSVQGFLAGQSREAEKPTADVNVRDQSGALQRHSGASGLPLSDLPLLGHERPEGISDGGSRSQDGTGPRPDLRQVQSGPGPVQGRPTAAVGGDRLPDGVLPQWVIWCGRNDEQDQLARALGESCVSIDGRTNGDDKLRLYDLWSTGQKRILISKVSVFGYGMNMQNCSRVAFLGLNDSWEQFFQAVRRCHRFGNPHPVDVHIVISDAEQDVLQNVLRKEAQATEMQRQLIAHVAEFERQEIGVVDSARLDYQPQHEMEIPQWLQ